MTQHTSLRCLVAPATPLWQGAAPARFSHVSLAQAFKVHKKGYKKGSKKFLRTALLGVALVLAACSSPKNLDKFPTTKAIYTPEQHRQITRLIEHLDNQLDEIWGIKNIVFAPTDLVKYSDGYLTRSIINFSHGTILFQTVNPNYEDALREEIVHTLLISNKPDDVKLYDSGVPKIEGVPFLVNQVVDNNGRSIKTIADAYAFAEVLVQNRINQRLLDNGQLIYTIELPMVTNHLQQRAERYREIIYNKAAEFDVDPRLMMAITETESAFNPYAVSPTGAIGLMQILSRQAGTDAFRFLGLPGRPTNAYLHDPENNVRIGATYIHIMQTRYFNGVLSPLSLRYLLTASYNGGPGGVLRMFDRNKDTAIARINAMTPQQVYNYIVSQHYSQETRRYLYKVSENYKKY